MPTRCEPVNRYVAHQTGPLDRKVNAELTTNLPLDPEDVEAQPFFTGRWRDHLNQDGTVSGPWTRLFRDNVGAANINIFNTYNSTDSVLRIDKGPSLGVQVAGTIRLPAWRIAQVEYKPYGGISPVDVAFKLIRSGVTGSFLEQAETDTLNEQKWWTLQAPGRPSAWRSTAEQSVLDEQRGVWAGLLPRETSATNEEERLVAIAKRTRSWAELALWYPALAPAAGAASVRSLSAANLTLPAGTPLGDLATEGRNIDFTKIGGDLGVDVFNAGNGNISHSYMAVKPLHEVWRGYRVIRSLFTTP